jgi:apolipoprotein N-acyltransferase
LAGLVHAALMFVAGPPLNLWPVVFIAVLPLAWLVGRPYTRPWRDAMLVSIGVLPLWGVWEWWTSEVTGLGYVPFICLQASWAGGFLLIARRLHSKWPRIPLALLVPTIWTGVEFFRGELFLDGYAWGLLAHPLIAATALASPAALLGTYFVSFLVAAVNGAIGDALHRPRRTVTGAIAIVGCGVVWLVSAFGLPPIDPAAPQVRPAIIQTNVPQSNKIDWGVDRELEDWKRFERLTADAAGYDDPSLLKPDFIIWPETMMPGGTLEPDALSKLRDEKVYFNSESSLGGGRVWATAFADRLLQVQPELGIPMLIGAEALVNLQISHGEEGHLNITQDARYNSVYLVHSGRIQRVRYDKVRLTPFGETMPYIRWWPWLQDQMLRVGANGMKFNLAFGRHMTVFNVPAASLGRDVRLVTPICFEITIASHCRGLAFEHGERRADLIVSVTNDGWFGDSDIARVQHLQAARWRAVELATPVARAANTGISALIDARGRILARGVQGDPAGSRVDGFLIGQVPLGTRITLYARIGDVFAWAAFAMGLAALIASYFRRKGPQAAEQGGGNS